MPTFAVLNDLGLYLKVVPEVGVTWVQNEPNQYPSKYSARRHLKELDCRPYCVKVVPLVTNEGNV